MLVYFMHLDFVTRGGTAIVSTSCVVELGVMLRLNLENNVTYNLSESVAHQHRFFFVKPALTKNFLTAL